MNLKWLLGLLAATGVQTHYTFDKLSGTQPWEYVRKAANWQSNGFVGNVNSDQIRCFQMGAGNQGAKTMSVQAGGTLSWGANPNIFHPGPLSGWMAKVPAGQSIDSFDGSGAVWFKMYQEKPTIASGGMQWASMNKNSVSFTIPKCLENGDYLFRVEHIGLHGSGNPQFYISCAQIRVSGGTGTGKPTNLVSFPGAYKQSDPGLTVNIYTSKSYTPAGPGVFAC